MKKLAMLMAIGLLMLGLVTGCSTGKESDSGNQDTGAAASSTQKDANTKNIFAALDTTDIDGNPVTSEIFADKDLTMINVWATFCGPCINEIPVLQELYQEYQDQGVGIVGLLLDTSTTSLTPGLSDEEQKLGKKLLADANATYPQLTASEAMLGTDLSQISAFPTTYFVDKDGNPVGAPIMGANSKSSWTSKIESYLELVKKNQ